LINCQYIHDFERCLLSLATLARKRYRCHLDFIELSKIIQLFRRNLLFPNNLRAGKFSESETCCQPLGEEFYFFFTTLSASEGN
jgi:hypothetical protein